MSDLKRWVDEIEGADGAERLLLETARDDDPGDDQTRQLWARLGPLIGPLGSPPSPASPPPTTPPSTAPPALPPPAMPAPLAPTGAAPAAAKIGALAAQKALVTAGLTKALAVGGLGAGLAFGFYDGYATRSAPETRSTTSASATARALASNRPGQPDQPGQPGQPGQPAQPGGLEAEAIAPVEPGVAPAEPGVAPAEPGVAPAEPGVEPTKPTLVPAEARPLAAPTGSNRAGATSSQAIGQGPPASMASALPPTLRPTVGSGVSGLRPPSMVGPSALEPTLAPIAGSSASAPASMAVPGAFAPTPASMAVPGAFAPMHAPTAVSGAPLPTPTTAAAGAPGSSVPSPIAPGSPALSPIVVAPQVSTGADPAGAAAAASAARPRSEASTAGRLVEESRLVVRARDELRRGQAGAALRTLDELGRSFPAGALTHERAALEVQALAAAGRREQARAKARAFVAAHPSSPLAPIVGQFAK